MSDLSRQQRAMSRRNFVGAFGALAAGGVLAACGGGDEDSEATTGDPDLDEALQASDLPEIEWDMATSWPVALDTIYGGAEFFAEQVGRLTGGRFRITAAPGGELVPPLEILQSVQNGSVESGHTAMYYYTGVDPIAQLATTIPFGMTARGHYSWLHEGGGLELIQAAYRDRFDVVTFPAGNTGCQMGGWFNTEISGPGDVGGLRFRIPGMGGQVMERLGASVQVIPGGEIYQALETGAIDGAEWIGPYDDLQQEFNKVASFYYYPGWWEPGPELDVVFPASEYDGLPEEYQAVIASAAAHAHGQMIARYDTLNPPALEEIRSGDVQVLPFPDEVMQAAAEATEEILDENASSDSAYQEILDSYRAYRDQLGPWYGLAEKAMLDFLAS